MVRKLKFKRKHNWYPTQRVLSPPAAIASTVFDPASFLYVIVTQVRPGFRLPGPVVRLKLSESGRVQ